MGSPVVHFDVSGPDPETTAKFYSELFGWHTQTFPELSYTMIDTHAEFQKNRRNWFEVRSSM